MKLKKVLSMMLIATLSMTVLSACGNKTETETNTSANTPAVTDEVKTDDTTTNDAEPAKTGGSIRLQNGKVEIDEQLKAFAADYEAKTGVHVEIESIGGGTDAGPIMKGYLAAGTMPDIFTIGGVGDYQTWQDYCEDLSGEAWVSDTDASFVGNDGKVVGFPYAIEGYGLAYNKDLLDKAGIDPATLTSYGAYEAALAKLDGMKAELGIDAVISMAASVSGGMTWSTGNHDFGTYLATGLDRSDTSIIDMLNKGEVDKARLDQYAKFVELLFKYSDSYVLKSGSYDEQLALWEDGKAVFLHQGNWIDPNLVKDGVTFACGTAPLAFMEQETNGILADAPSWWLVYKDSPNVQLAKDFLTALATTEEGYNCLVKECGMISPYKSCTVQPETPMAKDLMNWVSAGKTYAWQWSKMPEGFGMNMLGPVFESFANGSINTQEFSDMIAQTIERNNK